MAAHAKLSASGSKRWMECTKSVALEEHFPEEASPFAEEGTQAHSYAERLLKYSIAKDEIELNKLLEKIEKEMLNYLIDYLDYCMDIYTQSVLQYKDTLALIEERLDFSEWVPNGFGTGDFMIITPKKLIVIDLKYGKGVKVDAPENTQTRLYGLGGINEYGWIYPFTEVEMHIVQPRLNHISVEVLSRKALEKWGKTQVKKKAEMAENDCGTFVPGDHCKFCRARAVCKARATYMLKTLQEIIAKGGTKNGKQH